MMKTILLLILSFGLCIPGMRAQEYNPGCGCTFEQCNYCSIGSIPEHCKNCCKPRIISSISNKDLRDKLGLSEESIEKISTLRRNNSMPGLQDYKNVLSTDEYARMMEGVKEIVNGNDLGIENIDNEQRLQRMEPIRSLPTDERRQINERYMERLRDQ